MLMYLAFLLAVRERHLLYSLGSSAIRSRHCGHNRMRPPAATMDCRASWPLYPPPQPNSQPALFPGLPSTRVALVAAAASAGIAKAYPLGGPSGCFHWDSRQQNIESARTNPWVEKIAVTVAVETLQTATPMLCGRREMIPFPPIHASSGLFADTMERVVPPPWLLAHCGCPQETIQSMVQKAK
jgi:hypothetical protein